MYFSHLFSLDTLLLVYLFVGGIAWLMTLARGWETGDAAIFLIAFFFGWIVGLLWLPIVIFALVAEGIQWLMDNAPRFRNRPRYDAEIQRLQAMQTEEIRRLQAMEAEMWEAEVEMWDSALRQELDRR